MLIRCVILLAALATPAFADPATVRKATLSQSGGLYTFNVTVSHADTGWDHYVDAWRIKDESGTVLGTRELAHPHVNEQPFTRSLSGVRIPDGVKTVTIEARDNLSGWSSNALQVKVR